MELVRYLIGLGANLGDRVAALRRAVSSIATLGAIGGRSRIYSSAPIGGPPQPPYLNAALELVSDLDPSELLTATHEIERALGRDRSAEVRWGPRPIDIDLLLAGARGEVIVSLADLILPHPRLHERAFALAGLVELDGDLMHPLLERPLSALLREHARDLCAPTGEQL